MNESETIDLLVSLLDAREPFLHVRFGDGDVMFATGTGSRMTGDGEQWTQHLSDRLAMAWRNLAFHDGLLLVGDVETYAVSDGVEKEWLDLVQEAEEIRGRPLEFVHMEALRVSFGYALPFYVTAARDDRWKVFVGPERLAGAAAMLGADHVPVPLQFAHDPAHVLRVVQLLTSRPLGRGPEVAFFAAGRGGKIMQSWLSMDAPALTQVDVGSGLDILFTDLRRGTDRDADPDALRGGYRAAGLTL